MDKREIVFYKHYFKEFYIKQSEKTNKSPINEIDKAEKLMNEYFKNKI